MNITKLIHELPPIGSTINHLRVKRRHCHILYKQTELQQWLDLVKWCTTRTDRPHNYDDPVFLELAAKELAFLKSLLPHDN